MNETNEKFKLIINYEMLDEFCKINDFQIITKEMLKENNIFEDLIYATDDNFVGKSVYPKDMPLMMHKTMWSKLIKINQKLNEKAKRE